VSRILGRGDGQPVEEVQHPPPGVRGGLRVLFEPAVEERVWGAGIGDELMGHARGLESAVERLDVLCWDAFVRAAEQAE